MARREIFVDDIDGKEDETVQTRRYSVGHQAFTIDLSDKNYEKFLKALEPYMTVSTKEEAPARSLRTPQKRAARSAAPSKAVTEGGKTMDEVRQVLRAEGYEVKDRGRLSLEMKEKYEYHAKDKFL